VATPVASQIASVHRFSVEDVLAMVDAGILYSELRLELVDGVLIEMSHPGPRHAGIVEWLTKRLVIAAQDRFSVRVQDTLLTGEYDFRSPDLMVTEPVGRDRLPDRALLIIEVAHTSRARDLGKAAVYAAAGVNEYWIVDVDRDEVLVHREPSGAAYATVQRFAPGDHITPLVDIAPIDVAALLARRAGSTPAT
jgi:Uma2 family endonuclease